MAKWGSNGRYACRWSATHISRAGLSSHTKRGPPTERPTGLSNRARDSAVDLLLKAHGQIATPGLDLAEVTAMICERACALTGAAGASFARLEGEHVTVVHVVGIGAGVVGTQLPITNSVMALAILDNQVQIVEDTDVDLRPNVAAKRVHNTRSLLVVPLRIDDAHRYALLIAALQPNTFTVQNAVDLEVLAGAMTAALVNAARVEAESELKAQAACLEVVVQTQSELSFMVGGVEAGLLLVCTRARQITGASGASVARIEGADLVTLAVDGEAVGVVGDRIPADHSLIAWSIRRGKVYRTADVSKEPNANHAAAAEVGIRGSLIVPLTAADGTPWALTVNSTEFGAFSAAHETLMGLLAGSMAGALANAAHRDIEIELLHSHQQRQNLLGQLIRAQDEERARIAGDIHDDSVQAMTAAALRIGMARRGATDPINRERLTIAEDAVREAVARLRHLLFELRPRILDTGGIRAAVEMYVDQTRRSPTPASLIP